MAGMMGPWGKDFRAELVEWRGKGKDGSLGVVTGAARWSVWSFMREDLETGAQCLLKIKAKVMI